MMKNKKGLAPLVVVGIIATILFFLLGLGTTIKVASILSSIPKPVWYLLIGLIILSFLPRKK